MSPYDFFCILLISSTYYAIIYTQFLSETFETDFLSLFSQFLMNEMVSREMTCWKTKKETIHGTGVHSKWSLKSSAVFWKLWAPSSQLLISSFSWNLQLRPLDIFWGWMEAIGWLLSCRPSTKETLESFLAFHWERRNGEVLSNWSREFARDIPPQRGLKVSCLLICSGSIVDTRKLQTLTEQRRFYLLVVTEPICIVL